MATFSDWLNQIGFLVLFATTIEVLLPNKSIRKTTQFLIGLVVVLAVVDPLVHRMADPHWVEELWADTVMIPGDEFINLGTEIADSTWQQAEIMGATQLGREMAVLVTLVDGIVDATVDLHPAHGADLWDVDVTLLAGGDGIYSDDFRSQKEIEVTHLIHKMMEPQGVATLRLSWATP